MMLANHMCSASTFPFSFWSSSVPRIWTSCLLMFNVAIKLMHVLSCSSAQSLAQPMWEPEEAVWSYDQSWWESQWWVQGWAQPAVGVPYGPRGTVVRPDGSTYNLVASKKTRKRKKEVERQQARAEDEKGSADSAAGAEDDSADAAAPAASGGSSSGGADASGGGHRVEPRGLLLEPVKLEHPSWMTKEEFFASRMLKPKAASEAAAVQTTPRSSSSAAVQATPGSTDQAVQTSPRISEGDVGEAILKAPWRTMRAQKRSSSPPPPSVPPKASSTSTPPLRMEPPPSVPPKVIRSTSTRPLLQEPPPSVPQAIRRSTSTPPVLEPVAKVAPKCPTPPVLQPVAKVAPKKK